MKRSVLFPAFRSFSLRSGRGGWRAQCHSRFGPAVSKQDKAALERLLADDLEFSRPRNMSGLSKAEYIDFIAESPPSYEAVTAGSIY